MVVEIRRKARSTGQAQYDILISHQTELAAALHSQAKSLGISQTPSRTRLSRQCLKRAPNWLRAVVRIRRSEVLFKVL
jgi:hypothetical protein